MAAAHKATMSYYQQQQPYMLPAAGCCCALLHISIPLHSQSMVNQAPQSAS